MDLNCVNCESSLVEVTHGVSFTKNGVRKSFDNFECGKCGFEFWAERLPDGSHVVVSVDDDFIVGAAPPEATGEEA